jgi:hypothetical protein
MEGHASRGFAGLWSGLSQMHVPRLHVPLGAQALPHLRDASLSALAAAVVLLGVVILLELRTVVRLRQGMDRSLARVFEQLDLLRFESRQLLEERQSHQDLAAAAAAIPRPTPAAHSPVPPAPASRSPTAAMSTTPAMPPSRTPAHAGRPVTAEPSAPLSAAPQSATRGLSSGEARLLSSLAEARARRAAAS